MRRVYTILLILPVFFFLSPYLTSAFDLSIEKDLQKNLEKSRFIIGRVEENLRAGLSITVEISEIKDLSEEIKVIHVLLQERFRLREEEVKAHGPKAQERHRVMSEGYSRAIQDYLELIAGLPSERNISLTTLVPLKALLQKMLSQKKTPIFGSLPYKHLRYPPNAPNQSPPIKPAYRGGDKVVRPDDLKSTPEAPISREIAILAQSLSWNPVSIYEWVKNNIETEWYWGLMKGAEETLRQRSGNDCDQASLLIALLRASGYPSRYVRGTIEFFPGIERAKNLTGIEDPQKIAEYFQKAGIPFKAIISGGKISNLQVEHIWVETQVPYANYRGAILDEHGKTWLGLDTSIKVTGYAYNTPAEIPEGISLSNLRDEYLGAIQTQTPLEHIRAYINSQLANSPQPATYNDLLRKRTLIPEVMNILPASMQFRQTKITHEYGEIPDELKHKVKFIATGSPNNELFSITLDAFKLSNQRIALTYEPETLEDLEIINSYGGLDNTPAYLVKLRPVLALNGERVAVGRDGLPMGSDFQLSMELFSPNRSEKVVNTHITGNLSAIGIVAQRSSPQVGEGGGEGEKGAEQILYEEVIRYIHRWNLAEEELASLMKLAMTRPIPTIVTLGGVIDVSYLLDTPHEFKWKGVYVDVDLRAIEAVRSSESGVRSQREKTFMQLSSLQGSILENRIFEDDFLVESISTAKLFGLARSAQPATEILTLNKTNISAVLPTLPFDENIKEDIQNAVNQNFSVLIPQSEITFEDWTGVGYIKENPNTGESGYMLSGMIAGGMTAWGVDKWPDYYRDILENPYSEPPNYDPSSARYIQKISKTDLQKGKVGEPLLQPLQVLVLDSKKKPAPKVDVTFTVKAGGGKFKKNGLGSIKVPTDGKGIASVELILGEKTAANPIYWKEAENKHSVQVGENLVEASLPSGIRTTKPFTAYGFPGDPVAIRQTYGNGIWGTILSFSGFVSIIIEDRFGNPISNRSINFEVLDANPNPNLPKCDNKNRDIREAYLVKVDDPCIKKSPVWGDCGKPEFQRRMVETTSDKGAAIQIILGGLPGGIYPIEASYTDPISNNKLQTTFYHYTYPFGNCSGTENPAIQLILEYVQPADSYGNNINAGRVGSKVPVMAKLYFLKEKETEKEFLFTCDGNPIVCKKVIGTREHETIMGFKTSKVTFGGEEGKPEGAGVYSGTYTLGPGVNNIPIKGEASLDIRRTEVCPNCVTTMKEFSQSAALTYQVYGVEVLIDPVPVILVDENGYTKQDYLISYTINPPEYRAMTAFLSILKDGSPITYMPTEVKGKGTATISRGFQFDVDSVYEVEVALNYGTGVEITSGRRKLAIGGILVRDENGTIVDEVRFGDGSKPEKRYHLELVSKVLTESCWTLTGKIHVVNKVGQTITVPVADERKDDFYLPEYELLFTPSGGRCLVWLKDGAVGGLSKENFVLSNLSKEGLKERPFDPENLAVLYGGIGNKLQIEINDAKREVPIEPVGIVLIGIDGLRQDVLYPVEKDDVLEGHYRLAIKDLSGVSQILAGYDKSEDKQRYIMLPKVTAIFPSITYASWASIFTGKLPNETGITGNEFFARNLVSAIPGMEESGIPFGMVTLSPGAFQPGKGISLPIFGDVGILKNLEFVLSHVTPAESSILGSTANPTLSAKIANSAPLAALQAKPLFEDIGKIVRGKFILAPNSDIRCDKTSYECRTVTMYHQYAKGADWWGTPTTLVSELYNLAASGTIKIGVSEAEVMDRAPATDAIDFVKNYFSKNNPEGKKKRFPALFTIYYSGLDHYAHKKGMEGYSAFFKSTTDPAIRDFINALQKHGEFDNKIFIIVSDHGMTAMPTDLKYRDKNWLGITVDKDAEMSCTLKLDFVDPENPDHITSAQKAELANNNLHIWELAEVFTKYVPTEAGIKLLAPAELNNTGVNITQKIDEANVVAALNGPMGQIYVKGGNWKSNPDSKRLGALLDALIRVFTLGESANDKVKKEFNRLKASVHKILVRQELGGPYEVVTGVIEDSAGNVFINTALLGTLESEDYTAVVARVTKMNHADRSGDIVLLMKEGMNDVNHRFSTGVSCKSWHGGLNRSDSYVPFVIGYPGGNRFELDPILNVVCADNGCNGNWELADFIKEAIGRQYSGQQGGSE